MSWELRLWEIHTPFGDDYRLTSGLDSGRVMVNGQDITRMNRDELNRERIHGHGIPSTHGTIPCLSGKM